MTKLQNTNKKEFKNRLRAYLIENMKTDENEDASDEQVIADFFENFDRVANYPYNLQRFPNHQNRLADYLAGLPTRLPYNWCDIIEDSKKLHQTEDIDSKVQKMIVNDWWNFIAAKMIILFNPTF